MRGRRRPRTGDLVAERCGQRQGAAISRDIGEPERWVSDLLAVRSYRRRLPEIDRLNRLAARVGISPATLLVALAADRGLAGDDVTPQHVAMGAAFRALSPAGQRMALEAVRGLVTVPGLASKQAPKK